MVRKAVFPVAGFGTRFLPATKALPKELLPIIDKPLIQYAAEEAVQNKIDTLIFITGRNKRAIEDHFDSNIELENVLRSKGMKEEAEKVKSILPNGVQCIFIRQPEQLGLGHAVLCAKRVVGGEPFALLLADDFLLDNSRSAIGDLLSNFKSSNKNQVSVLEVDKSNVSKYGIIRPQGDRGVDFVVEKPRIEDAPSNLAIIGRYILNSEIFEILNQTDPGQGGEIQLTDALCYLAKKGQVEFSIYDGQRYDCGSVEGYIEAIVENSKSKGFLESNQ